MRKLLLLNGPANCGKNIATDMIKAEVEFAKDFRCKDKLYSLVMELFSVPSSEFWRIYNNRALKESPSSFFKVNITAWVELSEYLDYNYFKTVERAKVKDVLSFQNNLHHNPEFKIRLTIREAMIYVSEIICKPVLGYDYFGQARILALSQYNKEKSVIALDDSCGFADELPPAIQALGQDNIMLIRVKGRGTFEGDSRSYIPNGVIDNTFDVYNDADEETYKEKVGLLVRQFLNDEYKSR